MVHYTLFESSAKENNYTQRFLPTVSNKHRKRSSSLFALDELVVSSPPLSPSVSINFNKYPSKSGEIPIIFDFLTTSPRPSDERLSQMASLKPELPPLAKFSPISAFFPISDSSGTINTIGTHVFGYKRSSSYGSTEYKFPNSDITPHPANTLLETRSVLLSSEEKGFISNSNSKKDILATSLSMPEVQIQDYDTEQEMIDKSQFTNLAYLDPSSVYRDASDVLFLETIPDIEFIDSTIRAPSAKKKRGHLSLTVSTNQLDKCHKYETEPNCCSATSSYLSPPSTVSSGDKTPTQSTFLNRCSTDYACTKQGTDKSPFFDTISPADILDSGTLSTIEFALPSSHSGNSLSSLISEDKTPTQATYSQTTCKKQLEKPLPPFPRVEETQALDISISNISATEQNDDSRTSSSDSGQVKKPMASSVPETKSESWLDDDNISFSDAEDESILGPDSELPVPCLKHAQWLRDIAIELWIDQEGFRAIRPEFYLASVSNTLPYASCSDTHPKEGKDIYLTPFDDPLFTTVAEFLPVSRAGYYFHHAALDRAPTLNRIAANRDETRDYLTRTATLVLRDNGVFFVQGTEDYHVDCDTTTTTATTTTPTSDSLGLGYSHGEREHIIRLNWRFEYFVSNRRPDGRSKHKGEKVFTPLSFSCTPALLAPERAHKVKVLHIMKKTLLPNLVAQKLEPPDLPFPRTQRAEANSNINNKLQTRSSQPSLASLVSASLASLPVSDSITSFSSQKSVGGILAKAGARFTGRRKSVSHPDPSPTPTPKIKLSAPTTPMATPHSSNSQATPVTRHRRGSHSETTQEAFVRLKNNSIRGSSHHARTNSVPKSNVLSMGPIIPRDELSRMFDDHNAENNGTPNHKTANRGVPPQTSLPVPPRHR